MVYIVQMNLKFSTFFTAMEIDLKGSFGTVAGVGRKGKSPGTADTRDPDNLRRGDFLSWLPYCALFPVAEEGAISAAVPGQSLSSLGGSA